MENILESCLIAMREQGQTVDECLARHASQRDELEPLLRLALRLQGASALTAPPRFRQAAATRMQNLIAARPRPVATTGERISSPGRRTGQPAAHPFPPLSPLVAALRRRWAPLAFASLLLVVLLITGNNVVYAANRALPGEGLYPLKATLERAQLALSITEPGDADLHINFAGRRLAEARALLEQEHTDRVAETLSGYETEVQHALDSLGIESQLSPEEQAALAERFVTRLNFMEADLLRLQTSSPAGIQPLVERALERTRAALARARQAVDQLPGLAGTLPAPPSRTPTPTSTPQPALAPVQTRTATATPTPKSTGWVEDERTGQRTAVPEKWKTRFPGEVPTQRPTLYRTPRPRAWPTSWPTGKWPTAWPTGKWPTAWPTGKWPDGWPTDNPSDDPDEQATPESTPVWPTGLPIPRRTPDPGQLPVPRTPPGNWPIVWPTP